jgi:hypothetical protein
MGYYFWKDIKNDRIHIVLVDNNITLGFINIGSYTSFVYEIIAIAAENNYGYKMIEAAMDFIYPYHVMPPRNKSITDELIPTFVKFLSREDIEASTITPEDTCYTQISEKYNNWFNCKYKLTSCLNIVFKPSSYNFIKKTGYSFFIKKYPWKNKGFIE